MPSESSVGEFRLQRDVRVLRHPVDLSTMTLVGPGDGALLVIDTLTFEDASDGAVLGSLPSPPAAVSAILHNHCHLDHVGGDGAYPDAVVMLFGRQPEILAVERSRFPDRFVDGRGREIACEPGALEILGHLLKITPVGGHSFDSVQIELPHLGVVIAGENLATGAGGSLCVPHLSQFGDGGAMLRALDRLAATDHEWIVPAHGVPVDRRQALAAIDDNRHYLDRLLSLAAAAMRHREAGEPPATPDLVEVALHPISRYQPISSSFHRLNWRYTCAAQASGVDGGTD